MLINPPPAVLADYDDLIATLTNKTIDGDDNTIQDLLITALKTDIAKADTFFSRNASGVPIATKVVPAGAVVGTSDTQAFTNKTFDANGTGNSISNIDIADLAVGTDGELITWDASGNPAAVAVGTSTHVLTSNGVGVAPTFQVTAAMGLSNVVEDTTPQLGGQLDVNGKALGDGTLELLKFIETASAINEVTIKNAAIGADPEIQATGDDAAIGIDLISKGAGVNKSDGVEIVNLSAAQVLSSKTLTSPVHTLQTLTDGTNVAWNMASGHMAKLTLGGNRTLDNPTNIPAAGWGFVYIIQGAGGQTLALGSAYRTPGATGALSLSTGSADIDIVMWVTNDGTNIDLILNNNFG